MSSPNTVVVDVRVKDQFDAGHISAKHIPLADIKASTDIFKQYDGKKIIFYCNTGNKVDKQLKS